MTKIAVIGAGFAGSVCARLLAERGHSIDLYEKRSHIGGNAYDYFDKNGILVHKYGPHIFHTNSRRIISWLSQFTDWRFYEHRVLSSIDGRLVPFPINRITINLLYGLDLTEMEVEQWINARKISNLEIRTSEDLVLSSVGQELCDIFYKGYTLKQWGIPLERLSASVASRIPVRTNDDDRYFTDTYQFMPLHGYSALFNEMLRHRNISIGLETTEEKAWLLQRYDHIVYTGPIDEFYELRFGKLPYRSLRFEHSFNSTTDFLQEVGTVNYPNDFNFTRQTEFKHLTGQKARGTSTVREFPCPEGEPYYPIPNEENEVLFKKYQHLASQERRITFVGRLAQYRYLNMDQVVGAALKAAEYVSLAINAG